MIRLLNDQEIRRKPPSRTSVLSRFFRANPKKIWIVWGTICMIMFAAIFYTGGYKMQISFPLLSVFSLFVFCIGLLRWTIFEYVIHRYIFHYTGSNHILKNISRLLSDFHCCQDTHSYSVMIPFIFTLPLGACLFFIDLFFWFILLQVSWVGFAIFCGTAVGYLLFDTIHWSLHCADITWKWHKKMRSHHMRHNRFINVRFGVSNMVWDHAFGTYPASKVEEELSSPMFYIEGRPSEMPAEEKESSLEKN